jgi:hypothetical protein
MSTTTEQVLLTTRETRRSAGFFYGIVAPLLCVAVLIGLPALIYLEQHFLDQHLPFSLEHWQELAAGVGAGALLLLLWWLSFLGRQQITVSNERVLVETGFWNKVRDDVEVFRVRDVVVTRSLWQRLLGIGNITVKATEGRGQPEEVHTLRGVSNPIRVSEVIRGAWKAVGVPRSTTNVDG